MLHLIWRVRASADLNSHVGQDMFRLHQSNLITHDLVCASSQCHVFGSIVPAFMHGPRKRILLRWMGEDAQCCRRVTRVSYLLGQKWPQVLGDDTETAIGASGSAEANSIHLASNVTTCGSGFFCQEGSFQSASEAHFPFSCVFGSLQVLAYISTMACPAFSNSSCPTEALARSASGRCKFELQERTSRHSLGDFAVGAFGRPRFAEVQCSRRH